MFKKILVPLDGSQLSQRALEPAIAMSKHTGAELLLVRTPVVDTLQFAATGLKQAESAPMRSSTSKRSASPTNNPIWTFKPGSSKAMSLALSSIRR